MFIYETRVTFRDADVGGVVFFPRYFAFAHAAYEAFMDAHGLSYAKILQDGKYIMPIVHVDGDYRVPLALGEKAIIQLTVERIRSRAYELSYMILNEEGSISANLKTTHMVVDMATKQSMRIPDELKRVLEQGLDAVDG